MRITSAKPKVCVGCRKQIPRWWFALGDRQGWWHVSCMIKDGKQ